jgi:hypothetical protein
MPPFRLCHPLTLLLAAAPVCACGCTTTLRQAWETPQQAWNSLKGEGFAGWSENLASSIRGAKDAQPSGFFTDRRSEQIEQDLGGGF